MNMNRLNSTPAFKGNVEVAKEQPTVKKDPEETIMQGVRAAAVGGVALPTGLSAGTKIADKFEKIAVQFCDDFSDDAAKKASEGITGKGAKAALQKIKNFSTKQITELPKRSKSLIKWGIGGTIAALLIYLGTKDGNKDGKSDLLTAIKAYVNPVGVGGVDSEFNLEI